MLSNFRRYRNKIVVGTLSCLMVLTLLASPHLAKAQDAPAIIASDNLLEAARILRDAADKVEETAEETIADALANAAAVSFKNAITFFVTKIAEDTAKWVASGDEGQKPLFFTDGWGEYLQDVGESAAAEAAISPTPSVWVISVFLQKSPSTLLFQV